MLNGKVRYPVPLPSSVACGHNGCRGITGHGPWSDSKRRTKLENHFQDVHGLAFTACYPCLRCGKEFPSAQALNGHLRSSSGCTRGVSAHLENSVSRLDSTRSSAGRPRVSIGSSSVNSSTRRSLDPFPRAEIADHNVVALYPGRATRCPWKTWCSSTTTQCDWVIQGTGFHILQGLPRHLPCPQKGHGKAVEMFQMWSTFGGRKSNETALRPMLLSWSNLSRGSRFKPQHLSQSSPSSPTAKIEHSGNRRGLLSGCRSLEPNTRQPTGQPKKKHRSWGSTDARRD